MSYAAMSYLKRCVSTSYAWQWPRRLLFGLALVLLLPVSQSVVATPLCGVELNLTSVDFCDHDGQDGSVDALNNTARLKADGGAFSAENSSNAELGYRITLQSSGPAKAIFSSTQAIGRLQGASTVNEEQVSYHHNEPVAPTMTIFKVCAEKANRWTHKYEPSMHEGSMAGD